jgi:hypothetical protein
MYLEWPNWFWAAPLGFLLFLDFETFCEHVPHNKLHKSTNFIIFGPTEKSYGCLKILREVWVGRHVLEPTSKS